MGRGGGWGEGEGVSQGSLPLASGAPHGPRGSGGKWGRNKEESVKDAALGEGKRGEGKKKGEDGVASVRMGGGGRGRGKWRAGWAFILFFIFFLLQLPMRCSVCSTAASLRSLQVLLIRLRPRQSSVLFKC